MKLHRPSSFWKNAIAIAVFLGLSGTQLTGCNGIGLPPIEVTISIAQNLEIPAEASATGSADVTVGAFCDLFSEEDLDALVREAAGDLIADLVSFTSVELASTNLATTDGTFSPFTTATLTLTVLEAGAEPLQLGSASDDNGLGTNVSLTRDPPVDLLNDLEDGQCGVPTLRLTGAGLAQATDITFNVTATVLVYTRVNLP